ncbi:helix-turn-helix domain-containing protein [uncultured Amnibacterium sp.]|uniref:helix-turn-helix domain-containing protein n=1 Tax=uncultured Amnibacterium sp. TaxID=1631851 RepID=UPI0035C9BD9F
MYTVREAAALVRELRERRGWTQSELATRAHVSRSFVVDLEAGKPTVVAAKVFDVVQALGYEVAVRAQDGSEITW